jgi:hypothetical protein
VTNRRTFLLGIAALGTTLAAAAPSPPGRRIGWMSYSAPGSALDSFQEGMRALGYTGANAIGVEVRVVAFSGDPVVAGMAETFARPGGSK